jgi:hypothetical protein
MAPIERNLHLVEASTETRRATAAGEREDVGLTLMLLAVSALPLAASAAGIGQWSGAALGLGAVGTLLAGRELAAQAVARWRRARHP